MININKFVKKILPETLYIYLQNKKRLYGLPKQIKSIVSDLTSEDVCIDCGANVGVYSQLFASYGAKVYSFEPNPIAFNILKKKSEIFNNITPIMSAVGTSNTKSNLYLHKDFHLDEVLYSQSSSLIKKKNNLSESSIRIDVINFSEWLKQFDKISQALLIICKKKKFLLGCKIKFQEINKFAEISVTKSNLSSEIFQKNF